MTVPETEIVWAAGLFEGEGCIFAGNRHEGGDSARRLSINLTDLDVLERFRLAVGCGKIDGPYYQEGRKAIYQWRVYPTGDIAAVLAMLAPYLGRRRTAEMNQMQAILAGL